MTASIRAKTSLNLTNISLAIIVIALLGLYVAVHGGLKSTVELAPKEYPAQILGDESLGGNSRARWVDQSTQTWVCELDPVINDSLCSIRIHLSHIGGGIDLSHFETMTIWAEYQGNASHIRFYLRNRHPNYYIPSLDMSTKYNMIEVPVADLEKGVDIPMDQFIVPNWWLAAGNIPQLHSHPEFNDISIIEIQTGSNTHTGTHQIRLVKLRWSGATLGLNSLYQWCILAGIVITLCVLAYRLFANRQTKRRESLIKEDLLAINLALSLESSKLQEIPEIDKTTNLLNRAGIRDALYQGLMDWRSKKTPFSIIFAGLDNFKAINEQQGDEIGDAILKKVASLIKDNTCHTDTLCRWHNDEFVLVCPNTNLDRAEQIAEKFRRSIEQQFNECKVPLTASFGVATMTEANIDELIKQGDLALYRAKQYGRNRVCVKLPEESNLL